MDSATNREIECGGTKFTGRGHDIRKMLNRA